MSVARSSKWLFVFYPESAPEDWADVIESWCVTCYVSPVHDMDLTKDGEVKKPHRHGILCFDSLKSYKQVVNLVSQLGVGHAVVCESFRNSLRYLCHLDHPNKALYLVSDIVTFGYADLSALYIKSDIEMDEDLLLIFSYIEQEEIYEFSVLVDFIRHSCPVDTFRVLRDNHAFIRSYMQGRFFAARPISGQLAQGA